MLLQFLKIEVIHFQTQKSNSLISSVSWRAVSFIIEPPVCWYIPKLTECQGINDSYWKEEVLPQKAFDILQNRCGGWGEGVSQYTRGLVKSQSVLVNYNSFLGFSRVGNSPFNLNCYRPLIRWFIAKAAWFPGIMRQNKNAKLLTKS